MAPQETLPSTKPATSWWGGTALSIVASVVGLFVWAAGILSDFSCDSYYPESDLWSCSTPGTGLRFGLVPVATLIALALASTAREDRKYAALRPRLAVPLAWLILIGTWALTLFLAGHTH